MRRVIHMPAAQLAQLALLMASKDEMGDRREGLTVEVWKYRGGVTVKLGGHQLLHMTRKQMAIRADYLGLVQRTAPVVNVALPRAALEEVNLALSRRIAHFAIQTALGKQTPECAESERLCEAALAAVRKVQR